MKKRLLAALLVFCLLAVSSCSFIKTPKKESPSASSAAVSSASASSLTESESSAAPTSQSENPTSEPTSFDYGEYDPAVEDRLDEGIAQLKEMLKNSKAEDADAFQELYDKVSDDYYYLSDHSSLAYVAFSSNTGDEEASALHERLEEIQNDYVAELIKLYRPIYESAFKDKFYEDWKEEDIELALFQADSYSDEMLRLNKEVDKEIKAYQELDQNAKDFNTKSAQSYYNIVHLNMQIAKEFGFDNYAEYAYRYVYDRDFNTADAQKMYDCVKEYIVPMCDSVLEKLRGFDRLEEVLSEYEKIGSKALKPQTVIKRLQPYYEKIGGGIVESFESWKSHYFVASGKKALTNAFTTYLTHYEHPICFYGPKNCQSLFTYVHEQGHFNAFCLSEASLSSFDLCEVQSQGNEWLYMKYLRDTMDDKELADHMALYHLYDSLLTIMIATACDAYEQYVYTHPELNPEDFDGVFVQEAKRIGVYDVLKRSISIAPEDYWHLAIVDNSVYYLSYAVSKVPSIEIYAVAQKEGFEKAAEAYLKIMKCEESAKFVETITAAGFSSPFTEEPYKKISECFK